MAGGDTLARPGEIHFERRQLLAQFVVQFPCDACFLVFARLQHLGGQFAQFGLRLAQGIFRRLATRDVVQDYGEQARPADARLRNRRLDRKLHAVGAQRPED